MTSTLCEAVGRCQARRWRTVASAAPLPAAIVVVLVALAPLALARVGHDVGGELAGAIEAGAVAEGLVVGPVLAAVAAGAALAASAPGRAALGRQVAAGPCGHVAGVLAGLLVPASVAALAVGPSLITLFVALADELPGGPAAGLALAAATVAAVPVGAILVEGCLAAARGRGRRSLLIAAGAVGWGALGGVRQALVLGPLAPVAASLRGSESAWLALGLAMATAIGLALAWIMLLATRPARRSSCPAVRARFVRGGRLSMVEAVTVLLIRRPDVRLATAGALGFGATGIAIGAAASVTAPTTFLLATTTALLASVVAALAVGGVLLGGRWLWAGGPLGLRLIGLSACSAGVAISALPVAVVGVAAAVGTGATWGAAGVVGAFAIVGFAAALTAGALVPWCRDGVSDQLASFAALAVVAVACSLVVGLAAPRVVALGVSGPLVAVVVCGSALVLAHVVIELRLSRP